MEFVVKVAGQSERVVAARVFLWGSEAKVVVSDVENTIARRFEGCDMARTPSPAVHFFLFRLDSGSFDWVRVLVSRLHIFRFPK